MTDRDEGAPGAAREAGDTVVDAMLAEFQRCVRGAHEVLAHAPERIDRATYDTFRMRVSIARDVLEALHRELGGLVDRADALFAAGSAGKDDLERLAESYGF